MRKPCKKQCPLGGPWHNFLSSQIPPCTLTDIEGGSCDWQRHNWQSIFLLWLPSVFDADPLRKYEVGSFPLGTPYSLCYVKLAQNLDGENLSVIQYDFKVTGGQLYWRIAELSLFSSTQQHFCLRPSIKNSKKQKVAERLFKGAFKLIIHRIRGTIEDSKVLGTREQVTGNMAIPKPWPVQAH